MYLLVEKLFADSSKVTGEQDEKSEQLIDTVKLLRRRVDYFILKMNMNRCVLNGMSHVNYEGNVEMHPSLHYFDLLLNYCRLHYKQCHFDHLWWFRSFTA